MNALDVQLSERERCEIAEALRDKADRLRDKVDQANRVRRRVVSDGDLSVVRLRADDLRDLAHRVEWGE